MAEPREGLRRITAHGISLRPFAEDDIPRLQEMFADADAMRWNPGPTTEEEVRAAFDVLDLHRVSLFHAVDNEASCAVAQRAGFTLEGRLREGYRYGDGSYHDEHIHGLLASDLRASKPRTAEKS